MGLRIPVKDNKKRATKSGKQRRAQIVARRKARNPDAEWVDPQSLTENWPKGAVAANHDSLIHCGYSILPYFYVDRPFKCRDCDSDQLWRATQQKWYYEVAKGHIDETAIRCLPCRRKERERKAKVRADSIAGLIAKRERLAKINHDD
jgi:hypothetical protein